jgi:hypothetical protein
MKKNRVPMTVVLAILLSIASAFAGKGKGGGGKPPKDEEPADPVLLVTERWTSPLYVVNPDGQSVVKVISGGTEQPAWSPDGSFASFRGVENLFAVDCPSDINVAAGMIELTDPATNSWGDPEFLFCLSGSSPAFSPVSFGDESSGYDYALAFDGSVTTEPGFDPNALPDLRTIQVSVSPSGNISVSTSLNISNTLWIQEGEPAWSPDGSEIAVRTTNRPASADSSEWIHDLVVYKSDGLSGSESLIQDNELLGTGNDPLVVEKVRSPEWSRTDSDVVAASVQLTGTDFDIYCFDRNGGGVPGTVNLTQPLDDVEGDIDDINFAWLPYDSGIVVVRQGTLVEVLFDNPALEGCPDPSQLTARKIPKKRGAYYNSVDYLGFLWP